MHLLPQISAIALLWSASATALVGSIEQRSASNHTLYLATCVIESNPPGCPLGTICNSLNKEYYTIVGFYPDGPLTYKFKQPSASATISRPAQPWEGTKRTAVLEGTGEFESLIEAGALVLKKGDIAGSAKLGSEEFVVLMTEMRRPHMVRV
ncbi:hypothetical protein M011DRAFT_331079 [Sporormia fimetaria CBS 119925]|uniref:Uncharacterized protein n=1 Tax=Sporormia fimetaria CBS 119925 TaxID=1340428 RepID=A0A6A6UV05_9PLEO|nr:hypothetical protein M011DRAFT_331079 [Sporormia fimetaria CBS 119925]